MGIGQVLNSSLTNVALSTTVRNPTLLERVGEVRPKPQAPEQNPKNTEFEDAVKVSLSGEVPVENSVSGIYTPHAKLQQSIPAEISREAAVREYQLQTDDVKQAKEQNAVFIEDLSSRDQAVREHEKTHMDHLGPYARGGIQYSFTQGPDGFDYALTGKIAVDMSPAETPEKTLEKAQTIRTAALAPENPSRADYQVAKRATEMENKALQQIEAQQTELKRSSEPKNGGNTVAELEPRSADLAILLDSDEEIVSSEDSLDERSAEELALFAVGKARLLNAEA